MTWRIRPARESDVSILPEVERAAATLFPDGRIPDPDETHSPEELRDFMDRGLAWVGDEAGQAVGFVVARELDGGLHVVELAVDPRFGRRGIGTALMQRAIAETGSRNLPRVTLTTFEDLPWNGPFYRRLGFRVLHGEGLTEPLRELLRAERAAGLTRRVAMAFTVAEIG